MLRHPWILAACLMLAACTPSLEGLQQYAQDKLQQSVAAEFGRQLGRGVNTVVTELGAAGGYLDDPLVRILLPPPLGMVIGVARDLHTNPEAAALEILMNRAAEQAIPGAGPVLQELVAGLDPREMAILFEGDGTAATDYLRIRAEDAVLAAVLPEVDRKLEESGAVEAYRELLELEQDIETIQEQGEQLGDLVESDELGAYVAGKAVDGLFKRLGREEQAIRDVLSDSELPKGLSK
ncbi:MAG: DUF4197 domain-containing protein [Porticoccaceae bacterium]